MSGDLSACPFCGGEAADEIERLRAALEECCHMAGAYTSEADAIDWLDSIEAYSLKALSITGVVPEPRKTP